MRGISGVFPGNASRCEELSVSQFRSIGSCRTCFVEFALFTGVVALLAGTQTVKAELLTQDSADFNWKYEFTSLLPSQQNLDGVSGNDWHWGYGYAALDGAGHATMQQTAAYFQSTAVTVGELWGLINPSAGFTLEACLKTATQSGKSNSVDLILGGGADNSIAGWLKVGTSSVTWGHAAYALTPWATGDNASDYHTYRVVKYAGEDKFAVWRDKILLGDNLTNGYPYVTAGVGIRASIGAATGTTGGLTSFDYLRLTPGAFAPTPEPGTLVLLATGLLGLLAYAWRKRK